MNSKKSAIETSKGSSEILKALAKDQNIGMSRVDQKDIRPPMILLMQKSSALEDFIDKKGDSPKLGQFFHNGQMKILEKIECYILYAEKGFYINKRKAEEGKKPQYRAIGAMADDLTLFAMLFRSSSLYALGGLFTATKSMQRPMYSIKVTIETKMLENKDGKWWIPAIRKIELDNTPEKLMELYELAKGLDRQVETVAENDEKETPEPKEEGPPF